MKIASGQVAVITGGAGGIGYGLAEALAARGVRLVLADIREAELESAADALWSSGAEVIFVGTDVSDADAVERLAVRTLEQFGRVDLLCNSAGLLCPGAPLWKQSRQAWDRLIAVKLIPIASPSQQLPPLQPVPQARRWKRQALGPFRRWKAMNLLPVSDSGTDGGKSSRWL